MRSLAKTALILALICAAHWSSAADASLEKRGTNRPPGKSDTKQEKRLKNLTPEEREAKRAEIKARLEKRIHELREKLEHGKLSGDEQRELARREQLLKRFEQQGVGASQPPRAEEPRP